MYICPSTAFIVEKEFEIPLPTSASDKEFHLWVADNLGKYSVLKNAYSDLKECWDHYHLTKETPRNGN